MTSFRTHDEYSVFSVSVYEALQAIQALDDDLGAYDDKVSLSQARERVTQVLAHLGVATAVLDAAERPGYGA